jgi:hypothetical protein
MIYHVFHDMLIRRTFLKQHIISWPLRQSEPNTAFTMLSLLAILAVSGPALVLAQDVWRCDTTMQPDYENCK